MICDPYKSFATLNELAQAKAQPRKPTVILSFDCRMMMMMRVYTRSSDADYVEDT